jgi:hypothetical protein
LPCMRRQHVLAPALNQHSSLHACTGADACMATSTSEDKSSKVQGACVIIRDAE